MASIELDSLPIRAPKTGDSVGVIDSTEFGPERVHVGPNVFSTVAEAVAAITASPYLYDRVQIIERASSYWDVVTGETPDGFGVIAAGSKQLKLNEPGRVSSKCYGIPAGDAVSQNAAVTAFLKRGGQLLFAAGDYLLTNQGSDTDAVSIANFTKNLDVVCEPGVNFIIDDVDGDGIRISVPGNGSGIPEFGQTITWRGGRFDQSGQKNSTTMPFTTEYPPSNPGTSATADALSIRGEYNDGEEKNAIVYCCVEMVETYGGTHWEVAGGDSGIFVAGCREQVVRNCTGIGNRDLHVYASGTENGTLPCKTELIGNTALNCFHGHSVKRSALGIITRNHAENCARAVLADYLTGDGFNEFQIIGNTSNNCGVAVRAQNCQNFYIAHNRSRNQGAKLSDGTTIESYAAGYAFGMEGCSQGYVGRNSMIGVNAGYIAAYPASSFLIQANDLSGTDTSFVTFEGNVGDGLARGGADSGNNNSFIENIVYNATVNANMSTLGTNAYEVRIDAASNDRVYRNPIFAADGSSSAPSVARSAQPSIGMRFGTNAIHLTVNTADRVSTNNLGVAFNGNTPAAKPTISGSAESNAALINLLAALEDYGLIVDGTT